jgi:glucose 1-dehydrogenase
MDGSHQGRRRLVVGISGASGVVYGVRTLQLLRNAGIKTHLVMSKTAEVTARRFLVVLEGQPALVTGANSGIGKAVALGLAAGGADVVINYVVDPAAAEQVAHAIEVCGRHAITIKADVSNEDEVKSMFAQEIDHFGTLHIAVNNAGLQRDAAFHEMTLEQWNKVIGVNLTVQFLCAREAVREFMKRGMVSQISSAAGKLIFMSSVHQEIPWAGHVNCASSTGGVMQLTRSIAQEIAPLAIRANGVAPGLFELPSTGPHRTPRTAHVVGAVQAHRRARGHCAGGGMARFGCGRLPDRCYLVCRWRNEPLPGIRDRWLISAQNDAGMHQAARQSNGDPAFSFRLERRTACSRAITKASGAHAGCSHPLQTRPRRRPAVHRPLYWPAR